MVADVRDWFGTGEPLIVVEYGWTGSACQRGFQVADYSKREWNWVYADRLNCPADFQIREATAADPVAIILRGVEHDTMGVNPDREVERVYGIQDGRFVLISN